MTPADLRARRQALGLSQRALAEVLGQDHSTVWRWENGGSGVPRWLPLALEALERRRPSVSATVARAEVAEAEVEQLLVALGEACAYLEPLADEAPVGSPYAYANKQSAAFVLGRLRRAMAPGDGQE